MLNKTKELFRNMIFCRKKSKRELHTNKKGVYKLNGTDCNSENNDLLVKEVKKILGKFELY